LFGPLGTHRHRSAESKDPLTNTRTANATIDLDRVLSVAAAKSGLPVTRQSSSLAKATLAAAEGLDPYDTCLGCRASGQALQAFCTNCGICLKSAGVSATASSSGASASSSTVAGGGGGVATPTATSNASRPGAKSGAKSGVKSGVKSVGGNRTRAVTEPNPPQYTGQQRQPASVQAQLLLEELDVSAVSGKDGDAGGSGGVGGVSAASAARRGSAPALPRRATTTAAGQ
jgi:hypothetical protein